MMYVSQIITLYSLNLHSAICRLYLNKTGRKKGNWTHGERLQKPSVLSRVLVSSFSFVDGIPSRGCNIFSLSSHQAIDVGIVSTILLDMNKTCLCVQVKQLILNNIIICPNN